MAQQSFTENFYVPSDVLAEESDSEDILSNKNPQYQQEINNMLATILQTKRQMEATGNYIPQNTQLQLEEFLLFQEKYPQIVKKIQKKFKKFNLSTSQLLKFIKIENKFINIKEQVSTKSGKQEIETAVIKEEEPKKSRRNLVEVHGILIRKKSYQCNPRMFH